MKLIHLPPALPGASHGLARLSLVLLIAVLGGSAWLTSTFMPAQLPVATLADTVLPPAHPPADMSLSALPTGTLDSVAGFAYRGGDFRDKRQYSATPILVRHPKGDLLFDAGFGRQAEQHRQAMPWLMRQFSVLHPEQAAADRLQAGGYDARQLAGIVLTHSHWDHISGLPDLPGVPVWVNAAEHGFIDGTASMSALARSFGKLPYRDYVFDSGPYLGFDRSYDVWSDGSVVLVPAPGHTPGSVIVFIALPSGSRYALLGDLVWQTEGITIPAERPWILRKLVDDNDESVRDNISRIAAIQRRFPDMQLLPAHDDRANGRLPVFPQKAS